MKWEQIAVLCALFYIIFAGCINLDSIPSLLERLRLTLDADFEFRDLYHIVQWRRMPTSFVTAESIVLLVLFAAGAIVEAMEGTRVVSLYPLPPLRLRSRHWGVATCSLLLPILLFSKMIQLAPIPALVSTSSMEFGA